MKEAFELIKERLEEASFVDYDELYTDNGECLVTISEALFIVSEVEAEHGNGKTNADRIRSMSDEELAEFLCGVFDEDECDGKYICGITIPNYDEEKITEWLKSPTTD